MGSITRDLGRGRKKDEEGDSGVVKPCLQIYSCHDSLYIGLMCAFRLGQPAVWPEYGSYLKIDLFTVEESEGVIYGDGIGGDGIGGYYCVRFSLNGEVLKSSWEVGEKGYEESKEMIPLDHLVGAMERKHGPTQHIAK